MTSAWLVGLMFGLSAGFAPGPLLTLVISQTLQHSAREGVLVAAAPILTDVPIILASFLVLRQLSAFEPVLGLIATAGGIYVLYLAYETLKTAPVTIAAAPVEPHSLRKGALTNALNPHPYLFWATVGVPFVLMARQSDPGAAWAFIFTFYVLLVGSKVIVALTVDRFRDFLQGKVYLYLMRFLGAALAVFSILLFRDALAHFSVLSN
jgi:threonine/homoserine/homoserine lactone efflux protein